MEGESRTPLPRRIAPLEDRPKEEIEMQAPLPLPGLVDKTEESTDEPQVSNPPQASVQPVRSLDDNCNNVVEFVERNIFMRNCKYFIKNPRTQKCGCNRDEAYHTENKIPSGSDTSWSSDRHTSLQPTNAHGKIKLHGYGRLRAGAKPKYIRVNALMTDFETIWNLMIKHWGVPEPKIVLSINGGAKKMVPMTQRLRVALKKGLMNVSSAARTWFITSGFNLGVAKLVGEAVRDYSMANTNDSAFVAIGLATWGAVYNRDQLVNSTDNETAIFREENSTNDGMHIADYYNCKENPGKGQAVLDPHHTHFILCDDGTQRAFNKELNFRAQFENFIHQKMVSMMKNGSPVVQVVIEGGKKTIETAYFALLESTPVVVIRGSGRCADLICDLIESVNTKTSIGAIKMRILDLLNVYRDDWNIIPKEFDKYSKQLLAMTQEHRHLMHIFNVDGVSKELDRAILLAVFKSSTSMTAQMQLSLSMDMNRCDLATQEIFSDDKVDNWKNLDLDNAMFHALRRCQTGFVELFLDHGISIENFLTNERLSHLYLHALTDVHTSREAEELREIIENIKTPWWNYLINCGKKAQFSQTDKDILIYVGRVIQVFTGDTMPNPYSYDDHLVPHIAHAPDHVEVVRVSTCGSPFGNDGDKTSRQISHQPEFTIRGGKTVLRKVYPVYPPRSGSGKRLYTEQDLFFWAVLFNQMDLAKLFWRMGKDHIGSALIACAIFDQLQARAEADGEMELSASLEKNSDYFEMLATGILSVAYHEDKDRTHLLLIRCLPYYGNETLMSLADQNECMDFMSHTACQTKLNRIWMGGMSPYVPVWKIVLNLIFSIFFIRLIFPLRDTDMVSKNKVDPVLDEKHMLHAEYIDENAPNVRELRETMAAQQAAAHMDHKARQSFLEDFRWRQQHAWKHVSYGKALYLYYTAPVTKFILNMVSYLIFLLILCYLVMVELKPVYVVPGVPTNCTGIISNGRCIAVVELIVWLWIITLVVEEFRQIFMRDQRSLRYKLSDWISSGWNKFDCLMYLLFVIAVVLRYSLTESGFIYVRSVYALMMSMFFLRFMQTYYAHPVVGPKVVMVTKMVNDILFFVALFIIFVLAYGTAAQALLYPSSSLTINIVKNVFYYPYWAVFGELTLEEVEGKNPGETQNALVVVLFCIYMLFTNVLLLNLLIAMFGYTFENIQNSSRKIWAYNRYDLILEFFDRPFLPPPFIIFPILYRLAIDCIAACRQKCCHQAKARLESDFKVMLDLHENQTMSAFEQHCMERLMSQLESEEGIESSQSLSPEKHDHKFTERIDSIADQVSMLKEFIDRKGRMDSVLGEAGGDGRTPRPDVDYTGFVEEVSMMRDRLRGLEDKLGSQTKIMENIQVILQKSMMKDK